MLRLFLPGGRATRVLRMWWLKRLDDRRTLGRERALGSPV